MYNQIYNLLKQTKNNARNKIIKITARKMFQKILDVEKNVIAVQRINVIHSMHVMKIGYFYRHRIGYYKYIYIGILYLCIGYFFRYRIGCFYKESFREVPNFHHSLHTEKLQLLGVQLSKITASKFYRCLFS